MLALSQALHDNTENELVGQNMAEKKQIDWEKIELDYRAGIKTLRQIADEHGISHGAINKRAKSQDWSRDLTAKIAKKADELVSKNLVSKKVSKEKATSERIIIETVANESAQVQIRQRDDITRFQNILGNLYTELENITGEDNALAIKKLTDILDDESSVSSELLVVFEKMMSLPSRVKIAKDLGDTLTKIIPLERTIYKMDVEVNNDKDPLTTLLENISKTSNNGFGIVEHDPEIDEDIA